MTARIGTLDLGGRPRICVPVLDGDPRGDVAAIATLADLVELRIDGFGDVSAAHAAAVAGDVRAAGGGRLPVIATVRSADEGGRAALSDGDRGALYEAVLPSVDAVDIELRATVRDRVVERAAAAAKTVIVSYHDFERTPPASELESIVADGRACGADVVKIAAAVAGADDVASLLELLLRHRRKRDLIVIGMGALGAASRVFFPLVGSLVTYAHHRAATAPGQMSLAELHAELKRFWPGF